MVFGGEAVDKVDDVGVLDAGEDLDLAFDAFLAQLIFQLALLVEFDGYSGVGRLVDRLVYFGVCSLA